MTLWEWTRTLDIVRSDAGQLTVHRSLISHRRGRTKWELSLVISRLCSSISTMPISMISGWSATLTLRDMERLPWLDRNHVKAPKALPERICKYWPPTYRD
jgi:hypothetical protein